MFECGFKHGKGKMMYASGNYYDGGWKFDKKTGYGEMHWLTSNEYYKGYWEENMQNGFGVHLWLEEPGKLKSLRNRYEGMWFNGLRNGFGTFFYSDGSRYDGEWVDNLKEGFAVFTDPSGDVMEAIFKNDRLLQRLNEMRKIKMTTLVPEASEENEDMNATKSNIKGRKGKQILRTATVNSTPAVSSTKSPPRERSRKKKVEVVPPINKEEEFEKRNLENQVLNPYLQILRVDDLLETVRNKEEVLSQLEISLLHSNSLLMDIFKEYKALKSNVNELSCTMTLRSMWKFLRDCRILSPSLSLAVFDRHFYANPANIYPLFFDFEDLRTNMKNLKLSHYSNNQRKLDVLKKMDVYLRNDEVSLTFKKLDYDNLEESIKIVEQNHKLQWEEDQTEKTIKQQMEEMKVRKFNMHDPENIIQFRHYIDGIVRAVYIRENFNFENIGENISKKYIKYRVEPIVHLKSHNLERVFAADEEQRLSRFIQDYKIEEWKDCKELFAWHLSSRVNRPDPVNLHTSDVNSVRKLLKAAKMIVSQSDDMKYYKISERYFDPDSSYMEIVQKKLDLAKHYNRMQSLDLNNSQVGESVEMDNSRGQEGQKKLIIDTIEEQKSIKIDDDIDNYIDSRLNLSKPNTNPVSLQDLKMVKSKNIGGLHIEGIKEESYRSKEEESGKNQGQEAVKDIGSPKDLLSSDRNGEVVQRNFETLEMSEMLHKLLGHELLYFEFIENILLYLMVTVSIILTYRIESSSIKIQLKMLLVYC